MDDEGGTGAQTGTTPPGSAPPTRALLVSPAGLVPRIRPPAGLAASLLPALRAMYRWFSANFPAVLLIAIAASLLLVFVQGQANNNGLKLMGDQLRNALVLGAIYALVAIGYTMVYGIIELINFAHGDVFTASGFYALLITSLFGLDKLATGSAGGLLLALLIIFPITMVMAGTTGVIIERVAYRRLRNSPRLAPLITAIGVSFFLEGFILTRAGPDNVPTGKSSWITTNAFTLGGAGGVSVSWNEIFVVAVALALMFLLGAFIRRTRLGKAMRSTAQDRDAALLCGININRTISVTFFIGSALAAAGAIIYTIHLEFIQWNLGYRLGIIAFTAAVLGGIGNIVGAGVGGFLIGAIYVFGGQLVGGEWSESLIFAVLVIILTFRPVGLFGIDVTQRA